MSPLAILLYISFSKLFQTIKNKYPQKRILFKKERMITLLETFEKNRILNEQKTKNKNKISWYFQVIEKNCLFKLNNKEKPIM